MLSRRTLLTSAAATAIVPAAGAAARRPTRPFLNAYYFRAHMYTIVPRHVREDLRWMADTGTNAVSLAVLEQDLTAAKENIELICNEAEKLKMSVYAVPSRWGGIVAGAPKVPSSWGAKHPEAWVLNKEGKPIKSVASVVSSIFHPATVEFFHKTLTDLLKTFPIKGVIWDEPKTLTTEDHSAAAVKARPKEAGRAFYLDAGANFFAGLNKQIKSIRSDVTTCMFVYSNVEQDVIDRCAQIEALDHFGCDGRPWSKEDGGTLEAGGKVLIGPGARFVEAARRHGKKGLILVENHNLKAADIGLMDRRMPEVIGLGAEHLIYYYYPRNVEEPERSMAVIRKHLRRLPRAAS